MTVDPFEPFDPCDPCEPVDPCAPSAPSASFPIGDPTAPADPSTSAGATGPALAYAGPFEREPWPERLAAHVVEPGADARIHGYHVAGDLARHHGMADVAWLALRGELPTASQRAALDVACVLLAPVHVGQAATHAAFLARLAGGTPGATLASAAVGLGELVRHEHAALAPWLVWLDDGGGPVPAVACAPELGDEAAAGQRWLDSQMKAWFGREHGLPPVGLTRVACGYAILHRLGLRGPLAIETLTLWARLPTVAAEAAFARAGAVRLYPARLPDYQYVDGQGLSS